MAYLCRIFFPIAFFGFIILNSYPAGAEERAYPVNRLSVTFDVKNNSLSGHAEISIHEEKGAEICVGSLAIKAISFNGRPVGNEIKEGCLKAPGKGTLEISYEGVFEGKARDGTSRDEPGIVTYGLVGEEGISLSGNWHPEVKGLAYYKLTAVVPAGFAAISEAEEITHRETAAGREYSFRFEHPLTGINFVAGNYVEKKDIIAGIEIHAYFFREDIQLAEKYMEYAKRYFKLYNELLSSYPYKRFSIVENILPTGYSMPTFTLIGKDIARLPFIPETSLGHEIVHQWFGNYVYADFRGGNWLEAITTYLADHLYEEQKGKGWEYRKGILTNYQSYVLPEKDFPLKDFIRRNDFASTAIGYGKGAMLFHMLKKITGEEIFYRALRRLISDNKFKAASWSDVQKSFEMEHGKKLEWFFSQWLNRKGVPSFSIKDPGRRVLEGSSFVSFITEQEGDKYKITLPVRIISETGEAGAQVEVGKEKQYFEIAANENPGEMIIDENYDVMRRLSEEEFPPVIARLMGDAKRIVVYEGKEEELYAPLIKTLKGMGFEAKEEKELKDEEIKKSSLLVLGFERTVLKRLFGKVMKPEPGFFLIVKDNPLNVSKVVAYANADSKEETGLAAGKLRHYGKYSVVRFEKGVNVKKETSATSRGLVFNLFEPVIGVEPKKTLKLDRIMDDVRDKPVIFVGERHNFYEDHKLELAVIMDLYKKGKKFAIGMEMFQRPFQKALDDYLSGAINEKEFLKKSEYFKRWSIDYNFYREIMEFAKAKGIPVLALNLKAEILKRVEQVGFDGLTAEEKKEIPLDMDMSDDAYRQRLREIFETHPSNSAFDHFYQSQILWDETMAHSMAEFFKKQPDYQMVVLAGGQHIMYGSGIPGRFKRLTGKEYATLISGAIDGDIGDYVLFPDPLKPPFSAKLGVMLKKDETGVFIEDLSRDGLALKSGIKKGDIIASVDNWKIEAVEDVRIALYAKNPGDTVKVKIIRKRFLLGDKELELEIAL